MEGGGTLNTVQNFLKTLVRMYRYSLNIYYICVPKNLAFLTFLKVPLKIPNFLPCIEMDR